MPARAELLEVSKRYGDRIALHDVTLHVDAGEILALVGPNGAGKTTLARILATLVHPTGGRVTVCGIDAVADPVPVRRSIAIVPQGVTPDPYTTAWEHVYYYLQARGHNRSSAGVRTEATLRALELWEQRSVRTQRLSGGYQRRVILAMALATRPRLLLLDEPTTALDPAARRQVWEQLTAIRASTSILLTTHDMYEAEMLNDRVALIAEGRLVAVDTVPALRRALPATEKLVIDKGGPAAGLDRFGAVQQVAGRTVVYPHDPAAARALAAELLGAGASFSAQPTNLEDCYFQLLANGKPVTTLAGRP